MICSVCSKRVTRRAGKGESHRGKDWWPTLERVCLASLVCGITRTTHGWHHQLTLLSVSAIFLLNVISCRPSKLCLAHLALHSIRVPSHKTSNQSLSSWIQNYFECWGRCREGQSARPGNDIDVKEDVMFNKKEVMTSSCFSAYFDLSRRYYFLVFICVLSEHPLHNFPDRDVFAMFAWNHECSTSSSFIVQRVHSYSWPCF